MFLPWFVCWFVCLSAGLLEKLWLDFHEFFLTRNNQLDFGDYLNPGIFVDFVYHCKIWQCMLILM